jgi:glyoxylase-like metal-dependent hydrolase (beta-lactamase superfamily II)
VVKETPFEMRGMPNGSGAFPELCAPGVWRLTLPLSTSYLRTVNAYLFEEEDGATLIDCGLGTDETWDLFEAYLQTAGLPVQRVRRVLLTHAHHDHSGLAARIAATTGATIWVHQNDVVFFERRYVDLARYRAELYAWLCAHGTPADDAEGLAGNAESMAWDAHRLPPAERYRPDDRFPVGQYDLHVEWTPGHTPGHVCFTDVARGLVVCGDHILPNISPNVGLHPDSQMNPLGGYLASLESFERSDYRVALPGHGAPFDIQGRARELRLHQIDRRQRLLDLLASGPSTAYGLAERVWADAQPLSWADFRGHLRRNAVATLVAHLELLREEARVARSEGQPYRYELFRRPPHPYPRPPGGG